MRAGFLRAATWRLVFGLTMGLLARPAPAPAQGGLVEDAVNMAIRLTNATDCGGAECVEHAAVNFHRGSDRMLILVGRRGVGPTLVSYDTVTGRVRKLGPLFEASSPYATASARDWYFSARQPTTLYLIAASGSGLERYDVLGKTLETVFDAGAQFGAGRHVVKPHSSDDDLVHSATLTDSDSGAAVGCLTYREDAGQFGYHPARGTLELCQIDRSGRWLSIKDADPVGGDDSRVVDLETGTETPLLDGDSGPAGVASWPTLATTDAGLPDPTLLPVATIAQVPLTAAFNLLQVPAKAAGSFYLDPSTGVKVHKLTSATFPAASANWGHDYAEGGDEVSLPYNGSTRAVLVRQDGGSWWLVDFTPGLGVGNARRLSGTLVPLMDLAFTFSNNPATPYYAYVSSGATIRRFDIRTMTEAPGSGWPVTGESSAMWLHQSENDGLFVWMRGANGSTIVGYEPGTGTLKTYTNANLNEPRIDRAGRYVALSMNTPLNGLVVWDWQANNVLWTSPGDPGIPFAHNASLRRRWMTVDWNMSYPPDFALFTADLANSAVHVGGPANGTTIHGNGNWIQHPANLNDQWALFCHYGSLRPAESYWLAPGAMVLVTANGQRRILGHPYNTTGNYTFFTFAKFSSDGHYVLFTSDMNGAGRSDVFLAEVPQSSSSPDTTPPTVSVTAPAAGAVVAGSALPVSANAADDVGVIGVQFRLDGSNLGGEDTAAPFAVSWNTTLSANGSHTVTATARDAAGHATVSAPVGVTVSNPVGPPVISAVASSNVTASGATVTWTTDRPSDSQVEYGTTTAYGSSTLLNPSLVVAHAQALSGLLPLTAYHYRVKSRDAAGALAVSGDATFTTLSNLGQGLVVHLKLDEGSGTVAADSSGMGHPGSLLNGVAWGAGHSGQAVFLDGANDYVRVPHAATLNAFPLSVAAWFKTGTAGGIKGLVNKYQGGSYNGYQVFFNNGSLCAWYLRNTSNYVYDGGGCTLATAGYNDGSWHLAVFVVDAAGGRLYVDGALKGSRGWTGVPGPPTTAQELALGRYPDAFGGRPYLAGGVDDVRIYNRALTAAEVLQLYSGQP